MKARGAHRRLRDGGGVRLGPFFGGEGDGGGGLGGRTVLCGQSDGVPERIIDLASHDRANHALPRLGLCLERPRHRVGTGHHHRPAGAEGEPEQRSHHHGHSTHSKAKRKVAFLVRKDGWREQRGIEPPPALTRTAPARRPPDQPVALASPRLGAHTGKF